MSRVVLAMSGGVDSSVAADLLLRQGHEVIGVFMRHGEESAQACNLPDGQANPLLPILQGRADHKQGCCSASDAADARRVADRLNIPFYALDLQSDFKRIVDYFIDEYQHGRTPNPCVQCNNWLKFGRLFDYADSVGAEFVATGHYASLETVTDIDGNSEIGLFRGVDSDKDQSYVLAGIDRSLLPRMMLPVGKFHKSEIRMRAADVGLRVADKKDSQEICFVTTGKHGEFIQNKIGSMQVGQIVTTDGKVVGEHSGIEQFTIGQRKGVRVAMGEPYFVVRIDPTSNQVVIGRKEELARQHLTACRTNWLVAPPSKPIHALAQIRYNSPPQPAIISTLPDQRLQVDFIGPTYGVAPGQLVVCFEQNRVLGCGWIE